jgi:hypothetical protein
MWDPTQKKKKKIKAEKAGDVAQVVELLSNTQGPDYKPQYH